MSDYRLGLYEKAMPNELTLAEKLCTAKACGFDFMEISIDESDEKLARLQMPQREMALIRDCMYENDIFIETMCLSGHRKYPLGSLDKTVRQRGMSIMEGAIVLARNLGVRIIQIAGYDVYYEESGEITRGYFEENLKKSVGLAAQYGVVLAFETMETDFINTVEKALYWVEKIRSPYLMIYPDTGNITNAAQGQIPVQDLLRGEGHLAALHLKESLPGVFREVPYGSGHVRFETLIPVAYALGVRRFLAECWYVGQEDWRRDICAANGFFRRILAPLSTD